MLVNNYTIPDLQRYVDPSGSATVCTNSSATPCGYAISNIAGTAVATYSDWKVCAFLENPMGGLAAGKVSISSTDYTIHASCN